MDLEHLNFAALVQIYEAQGLMSLGKFSDPMTGKVQKNLMVTQMQIRILEVLQEKTQGNLTPEEDRLLQNSLTNLRLNFVEEQRKEQGESASPPKVEPQSDIIKPFTGLVDPTGKPL